METLSEDFLKLFSAIITGDDYESGKPSPDPFLKGAEALGLLPELCIAVENAPLGVKSAKSAGSYCVAISSTVKPELLQEADLVIASFGELSSTEPVRRLLS